MIGLFGGFLFCMGVTYFLSVSHWFNFSPGISYAVLKFSVACVKQGDLALFLKEQEILLMITALQEGNTSGLLIHERRKEN